MKNLFIVTGLIVAAILIFQLGLKIGAERASIDDINEIHFIDKHLWRSEPTFQGMLLGILKDTLKNTKPPYTKDKLNNILVSIEHEAHLKNFMSLLAVDSNRFQIIVGESRLDSWQNPLLLVDQDSTYYLKPLRIKYDLKK